jgi:hypothetical protein
VAGRDKKATVVQRTMGEDEIGTQGSENQHERMSSLIPAALSTPRPLLRPAGDLDGVLLSFHVVKVT